MLRTVLLRYFLSFVIATSQNVPAPDFVVMHNVSVSRSLQDIREDARKSGCCEEKNSDQCKIEMYAEYEEKRKLLNNEKVCFSDLKADDFIKHSDSKGAYIEVTNVNGTIERKSYSIASKMPKKPTPLRLSMCSSQALTPPPSSSSPQSTQYASTLAVPFAHWEDMAQIFQLSNPTGYYCTGTFLLPDIVWTAAKCIKDNGLTLAAEEIGIIPIKRVDGFPYQANIFEHISRGLLRVTDIAIHSDPNYGDQFAMLKINLAKCSEIDAVGEISEYGLTNDIYEEDVHFMDIYQQGTSYIPRYQWTSVLKAWGASDPHKFVTNVAHAAGAKFFQQDRLLDSAPNIPYQMQSGTFDKTYPYSYIATGLDDCTPPACQGGYHEGLRHHPAALQSLMTFITTNSNCITETNIALPVPAVFEMSENVETIPCGIFSDSYFHLIHDIDFEEYYVKSKDMTFKLSFETQLYFKFAFNNKQDILEYVQTYRSVSGNMIIEHSAMFEIVRFIANEPWSMLDIPNSLKMLQTMPDTLSESAAGRMLQYRASCMTMKGLGIALYNSPSTLDSSSEPFFAEFALDNPGLKVEDDCFISDPVSVCGEYLYSNTLVGTSLHALVYTGVERTETGSMTYPSDPFNGLMGFYADSSIYARWQFGDFEPDMTHLLPRQILSKNDLEINEQAYKGAGITYCLQTVNGFYAASLLTLCLPECYDPTATPVPVPQSVTSVTSATEPTCVSDDAGLHELNKCECLHHSERVPIRHEYWGPRHQDCIRAPDKLQCVASENIIVTSDQHRCAVRSANGWHCVLLPETTRIYVYADPTSLGNTEKRYGFKFLSFKTVIVEKIKYDILPHPNLAKLFADEAAATTPNDYAALVEGAMGGNRITLTPNAFINYPACSLNNKCDIIHYAVAQPTSDWYADIRPNIDIYTILASAGGGWWIKDVDDVQFGSNAMIGYTKEAFVNIEACRYVNVYDNYHAGVSGQRLLAFGLPVDDNMDGFINLQNMDIISKIAGVDTVMHTAQLDEIYFSGGFLVIFNGGNGDAVYGNNPCLYRVDPTNILSEQKLYSAQRCDAADPFSKENTIYNVETDYDHRSGCVADDRSCDTKSLTMYNNHIERCTFNDFRVAMNQAAWTDSKFYESNIDGIALLSVPGLVYLNKFNDYLINDERKTEWSCNTALDVAIRRPNDLDFRNNELLIDSNIIRASVVKSEGTGSMNNNILFQNNIFFDTSIMDYHVSWRSQFNFNTFLKCWGGAKTSTKRYQIQDVNSRLKHTYHNSEIEISRNLIRSAQAAPFLKEGRLNDWDYFKPNQNIIMNGGYLKDSTIESGDTISNFVYFYDLSTATDISNFVDVNTWEILENNIQYDSVTHSLSVGSDTIAMECMRRSLNRYDFGIGAKCVNTENFLGVDSDSILRVDPSLWETVSRPRITGGSRWDIGSPNSYITHYISQDGKVFTNPVDAGIMVIVYDDQSQKYHWAFGLHVYPDINCQDGYNSIMNSFPMFYFEAHPNSQGNYPNWYNTISTASALPQCAIYNSFGTSDPFMDLQTTIIPYTTRNQFDCINTPQYQKEIYKFTEDLMFNNPEDIAIDDIIYYASPYATIGTSNTIGMGRVPTTVTCGNNNGFGTGVSPNAVLDFSQMASTPSGARSIAEEVDDVLRSNLVQNVRGSGGYVARDFCGNRRNSDTIVGAFEDGSYCLI